MKLSRKKQVTCFMTLATLGVIIIAINKDTVRHYVITSDVTASKPRHNAASQQQQSIGSVEDLDITTKNTLNEKDFTIYPTTDEIMTAGSGIQTSRSNARSRSSGEGQRGNNPGITNTPDQSTLGSEITESTTVDEGSSSGYLIHPLIGRLGNELFQYASLYCVAMATGLTPVFGLLNDVRFLQDPTFGGRIVFDPDLMDAISNSTIFEHNCCSFDEWFLTHLQPDKNYSVRGYFQSWRYFEPCKDDVVRMMTFKKKYVTKAVTIVKMLRQKLPSKQLIGIHIRMEDHTDERAVINGKRVAEPEYYVRAMTYFRRKFEKGSVSFVVILSETSREWWLSTVTSSRDVIFLDRSHPAVDMEVLSRLDHLIMSVGTFGWWAGYRNKGTVVYCKDFAKPGSRYGNQFKNNATDFFLPGWIGM